MKFLLDPVYTNRPRICSTSYLMWELIQNLIDWRDDTFFYVLYPPNKMEDEDWEFVSQHPGRVTMLPLQQSTSDRVSESFMLRNQLRFYLNPWNAQTWDTDVVVTSRMPVLKHMRVHASREGGKALRSHRLYVGLEEMPILPFRDSVPWFDELYPDTLLSYGLADAVLINNQWTKALLRPVLREVFSAAWQKRIWDRLYEVVPVKLARLKMEKTYQPQTDFNVTFVGRMTSTRNFTGVMELFRKEFSYPLGPNKKSMKFLISTNSETWGQADPGEIDFIDLQLNNREQFYQFLEQAHVAVNLSDVEDFSLSTYETLRAGVPTIVADKPWSLFLGESYPFRAQSDVEAYAMISAFVKDYATQYNRFKTWEATYWKSYVENPSLNVTTGERLIELVLQFEVRRRQVMTDTGAGGIYKEYVLALPEEDGCIDLGKFLKENGRMYEKVDEHFSLVLGRTPSTLTMKLMAEQLGYHDTEFSGIMHRVQSIAKS